MIARWSRKFFSVWKHEGLTGLWVRIRRRFSRKPQLVREDSFDALHGTETGQDVNLWNLRIESRDWTSGVKYHAISRKAFSDAIGLLPIRPEEFTFIDLGSGKGRALILAAEFGFRRVIGVEFSKELCDVARMNLAVTGTSAEIHCMSAAEFSFPQEQSVVYMYDPFQQDVLRDVLSHLPTGGYLVYVNPKHSSTVRLPSVHSEPGIAIYSTTPAYEREAC